MTKIRPFTDEEAKAFGAVRARLLGAIGPKAKGYYAEAAFRVKPMAAEGLNTWAVDKGWRMYVDTSCLPGGEKGWTVQQCESIFEHELNHLLRDHAIRMDVHAGKQRDPNRSNIATDLEINDDLEPDSFVAEIGLLPSKMELPDGKTAEWYYENLPQQESDDSEQSESGSEGGDDSDDGDDGTGNSKPKMGKCGSGAGGNPIDGELDSDDASAPGMSEGEAKIVRQATAQAIKQHEAQHGRGTVPGGLSEWADIELAPPTVPWQRILAASVRRGIRIAAGNTDHTYTRISRRSAANPGFTFPAMVSPKPSIAVILDTSGSMSKDMIVEALNEVQGIAKQMGCQGDDLTLVQVDAAVGSIKPFTDARKVELTGRGGTDMRVGFDAIGEMRKAPSVIVVLTDGETPWPTVQPKGVSAVVVGIIGDEARRAYSVETTTNEMPWAKVVEVGAQGL